MASVGAGLLAVFILGYGNQALESWRLSRWEGGSLWLRPFFSSLNQVAWRFSPPSQAQAARIWPAFGVSDPARALLGAAVRDGVIVILAWLLLYATGRGISAVRGRLTVFIATLGVVTVVVAAAYTAVIPLQFGPLNAQSASLYFFESLATGLITGLITGLVAALLVLLVYRSRRPGAATPADLPPSAPPGPAALGESDGLETTATIPALGDADRDR
jgi:ribose/xylose/arabinose/galactoside ABC-type transport system permease subunit